MLKIKQEQIDPCEYAIAEENQPQALAKKKKIKKAKKNIKKEAEELPEVVEENLPLGRFGRRLKTKTFDLNLNILDAFIGADSDDEFDKESDELSTCSNWSHSSDQIEADEPTYEVSDTVTKCIKCKFETFCPRRFDKHMKHHKRRFSCSLCVWFFTNSSDQLKTHIKTSHHNCKDCEFVTNNPTKLLRHTVNEHGAEKPFKCSECSFSAVQSDLLRCHMEIHTKKFTFNCSECDYGCRQKFQLDLHTKKTSHDPVKPFKCEDCTNVSFLIQTELLFHRRQQHNTPHMTCSCGFGTFCDNYLGNRNRCKCSSAIGHHRNNHCKERKRSHNKSEKESRKKCKCPEWISEQGSIESNGSTEVDK